VTKAPFDEAAPKRRRSSRPTRLAGSLRPDSSEPTEAAEPSKPAKPAKLEAPHRREEETRLARLADFILLSFWRTASWVVGHTPAGPTYRVGGWVSMIGYALGPKRRRWLRANFGHVLDVPPTDKAAGRMARAAYRNYARYILELMRLPWVPRDECEKMLEIEGLDRFLDIYHNANGLILVAAHLGNNEAAAAGFVSQGLPISVVGDDTAFNGLYELLNRQRAQWGVKIISWRNLRGVYKVLHHREPLVLLVDWGYRPDGIPVRFFNAWTTLPAGPAQLAGRHGSTIVPVVITRLPDGTFRAAASDPITVSSTEPAELARATQEIAHALERFIAPAPEQWYIFKPIWPTSPEEERQLATGIAALAGSGAAGASATEADGLDRH
jgi:KDO2-lipid IV(A) lauroyltransferase